MRAHAKRHAARRAEQVAEHRNVMSFGLFKQNGRAARTQYPVANFCHFQIGIDFCTDTFEFAHAFQARDEIAKVVIMHDRSGP